jgi:hypothetical protein
MMEGSTKLQETVAINVRDVPRNTWRDFRAVALLKGYATSELLIKVMEEYLDRQPEYHRAKKVG